MPMRRVYLKSISYKGKGWSTCQRQRRRVILLLPAQTPPAPAAHVFSAEDKLGSVMGPTTIHHRVTYHISHRGRHLASFPHLAAPSPSAHKRARTQPPSRLQRTQPRGCPPLRSAAPRAAPPALRQTRTAALELEAVGHGSRPVGKDLVLERELVCGAVARVAHLRRDHILHVRVEVVKAVRRQGEAVHADAAAGGKRHPRHVPAGGGSGVRAGGRLEGGEGGPIRLATGIEAGRGVDTAGMEGCASGWGSAGARDGGEGDCKSSRMGRFSGIGQRRGEARRHPPLRPLPVVP
eukprot:scaffold276_cov116-Isochrysis_galbana.AAC.12